GVRRVHSRWRAHLLADLLWCGRSPLGGALADIAPWWSGRFSRVRERVGILPCILPRFLRDRIHHHPPARTGCRKDGDRSHLARRHAWREYADELHASTFRIRALLSPLCRSP